MSEMNVDYSNWFNKTAFNIAKSVDTDGINGLNSREVSIFQEKAKEAGITDDELKELLGASFSSQKVSQKSDLSQIAGYYSSLSYEKRGEINNRANELGYEIMAQLERDYNIAFEECEAYGLIKLRRDIFEDKVRFDFQEVHNNVETAMKSLNELKDRLQYAFEKAYGEEKHTTPKMTEYDLDKIAEKYFGTGMTFKKIIETYDLEFTKSTTISDLTPEQRILYDKARAYVKEIKTLAREEAQNMRFNSGERLLEETKNYTDSSIELIDFQMNDIIGSNDIFNMKSMIMRRAFVAAVSEQYKLTGVHSPNLKERPAKYIGSDKQIHIKGPDGSEYGINGIKNN